MRTAYDATFACKITCQPRMTRLSSHSGPRRDIWGVTWICKLRSVQNTGHATQAKAVCQEPGVPDTYSRGLGSMPRYSAQILICSIAYIFIFYSSLGLIGDFAGLPPCTVPSAIVHCNQNEAGHQKINLAACFADVQAGWNYYLTFMPQHWWNWRMKWTKSVSSLQLKGQVNGECFAYMWVILLFSVVWEVRLFWKLIRSRIWKLSHSCQTEVDE